MPRMFPPPGAQELRHGGRPVAEDGIDVSEVNVAELLADGWSTTHHAFLERLTPVAETIATVSALAADEEEPQS